MSSEVRAKRRYLPPIFDVARLFPGLRFVSPEKGLDKYREVAGFPFGSRILLTGEAGAGKTTFALAIVRALMAQWGFESVEQERVNDRSRHFGPSGSVDDTSYTVTHHELCFLSSEVDVSRLTHLFSQYGWFTKGDPLFKTFDVGGWAEGLSCFVPRISEAKIRLPPHGSGDLVDLVLKELKDSYGRRPPGQDVFVVVDSVTAVLKDSRDAGERRRDLQNFLERLEDAMRPSRAALVFLLAERPALSDPVTFADEVAADFVFHLGLNQTSPGRWQRTFAVTKSAGVHMTIGEHTWAVVTNVGMEDVIAQPKVAEWVQRTTQRTKDSHSGKWATVALFPKTQLQPIGHLNAGSTTTNKRDAPLEGTTDRRNSGITGLDELLAGHVSYWITGVRAEPALKPGTTTLLVGTAGSGKTTMCLQFLSAETDPGRTLYVNFEAKPQDVQRMYEGRSADFQGLFGGWNTLYRRRLNLDVNLLLAELRFVMETAGVVRVALDGLSDLLATTQRDDYARLVEAVLGTIRDVNPAALTFVAFEFDPARLEWQFPTAEGLSATADNVVVLRRILINDEFRRTAYVLKARGMNPDAQVREVHITDRAGGPLSIASGLESHSDLLSHHPKPIEIYLQLFSENRAERKLNKWLGTRLKGLFGHVVHTFGFSRPAIARTLDDLVSSFGRIPHSDVKVVTLDEWWVREYGVADQREWRDRAGIRPEHHPLLELDSLFRRPATQGPVAPSKHPEYRASPGQFWVFEVEKASSVVHNLEAKLRAVPNYTDFGLFCVDQGLWDRLRQYLSGSVDESSWPRLLQAIPRAWVRTNEAEVFGFAEPNTTKPKVIVDFMAASRKQEDGLPERDPSMIPFAFDMETSETVVCFYFELCWSFGASEDFLIRDVVGGGATKRNSIRTHPATQAMRLLQYLVYHGLMAPLPSLRKSKPLFSRHWYSTITEWHDNARRQEPRPQGPVPLPFFPVGVDAPPLSRGRIAAAIREAYTDIFVRFDRLARRVDAALRYRGDVKKVRSRAQRIRTSAEALQHVPVDLAGLRAHLKKFQSLGNELRQVALASRTLARGRIPADKPVAEFEGRLADRQLLPAARTLNLRDVLELLRWHDMRTRILLAELQRKSLRDVVLGRPPVHARVAQPKGVTALTGYCCSGSWMLGVGRRTHSPLLSWKLMEEMTSFDAAVKRSQEGAGVPVRKDFYDVFGEQAVRHIGHLTWNDLLLFAGSRARRRDRTLCPGIKAAPVFDTVTRLVLQCLTLAKSWRDMKGEGHALDADAMNESATEAVAELFNAVATAMESMPSCCASCTHQACRSMFPPTSTTPAASK